MTTPVKAVVIGGTGLVGRALLAELVRSGRYAQVLAWVRQQPSSEQAVQGVDYQVVDFGQLSEAMPQATLQGADAFSTLGTTLKQAGSRAAFRAVDLQINRSFAALMKQAGARHLLLLSALGASATSRFFYNQVKGELEQAVQGMDWPRLSIFQPSLLLGAHEGRRAEQWAQQAFHWIQPWLPKRFAWRPIEAERVAQAMAWVAAQPDEGSRVRVYSNLDLLTLTQKRRA